MSKTVILYVEDDDFSRDIMELLLDDYPQYDLIMYADSQDFEAKIQQLPDDLSLILLDIHIEPHDGFAMLKILRQDERFKKIPIMALTASVMSEEITELRTSGFDGAIAKPIDQDNFVHHIEDTLNGKLVWTI